ncbi:DUF3299 domain-containing protein [Primorskyibacter sedentarius]|uniref:DUF3299 domain-containing protein n=1 Tax=Primorskyibacter sedentarius TaxID=745311 RepID=A0A4R3JK71_9RHOB|nr:DUF3299 domain-containing protein [Primorskyibacter sedentarius]TCS66582.1 hypothetical protein EDD52_102399 [Primorskyibacter sedentarius]
MDNTRRNLCFGLAGLVGLSATGLRAEEIVDLEWRDLVPKDEPHVPPVIQGLLPHDESTMASSQPPSAGVRTDWNGRTVRLSGYIIPLDFKGTGVTAFMLVPYVGACVHVPPPPANQLVMVTTERPFESDGLFTAVTVTGMFGTASTSTQLADIGYALSADKVVPYGA